MALTTIDWNPAKNKLRTLGLTAFVVFGALAALAWFRHSMLGFDLSPAWSERVALVLAPLAAASGLLAVTAPRLLRPLHVFLLVITWPIGLVVSELVLLAIYYGVFVPTGFIMSRLGRDRLRRKFDRTATSYWQARTTAEPERYLRQY